MPRGSSIVEMPMTRAEWEAEKVRLASPQVVFSGNAGSGTVNGIKHSYAFDEKTERMTVETSW